MKEQEKENKAKSVPLLIYEGEMRHKKNIIVGLFIILGLVILVFGIAICMFIKFISAHDFVGYNQNGNGVNNLNSGTQGDIINESTLKNND
jgi:uncharacterized membrane protein